MTTIETPTLTEDEELYAIWHTTTCNSCGDVGIDYGFYYVGNCTMSYAYCNCCIYFLSKEQKVIKS